ncbi:MAG TPA: class I SAM-dependent methyltransferase [Dehalococcoidia bacterium]|jgi:demethylmenaquinone methyltransferase/2-methoxy-6-polyprenyl-1,4-benzoquinol methylase|nr:class I SAM-dependent methyltransferase [Dehalococcoidia bacterium]
MGQGNATESKGLKAPAYYRQEAWDKFARWYDPLVKLVLLPFGGEGRLRRKFVDFAAPKRGEQMLDVCSGTGTLASVIAERVGGDGKVIGVDLSLGMIRVAQKKVKSSVTRFQSANSESLPFPSSIFHSAFISFGLHEMPESARQNTLREIHRTLKPGGYLFVLDYHLPRGGVARFIIKALVRLLEEDFTYKMLLEESLTVEVKQAGFVIERRELISAGAIQMIRARKISEEGAIG